MTGAGAQMRDWWDLSDLGESVLRIIFKMVLDFYIINNPILFRVYESP
jgi:hypothetical protein